MAGLLQELEKFRGSGKRRARIASMDSVIGACYTEKTWRPAHTLVC